MSHWRGKYLDTGPHGVGHYSEDGRWWWDDGQGRWFRTVEQEDVLEIGAEDVGGISLAASLATTLSSQYGNGYFRFVTRANSADPRWPTSATAGGPSRRPGRRWSTLPHRAPGWKPSGSGSTSCTGSCSRNGGGRRAGAPTGGRPSTDVRPSTWRPRLTPTTPSGA